MTLGLVFSLPFTGCSQSGGTAGGTGGKGSGGSGNGGNGSGGSGNGGTTAKGGAGGNGSGGNGSGGSGSGGAGNGGTTAKGGAGGGSGGNGSGGNGSGGSGSGGNGSGGAGGGTAGSGGGTAGAGGGTAGAGGGTAGAGGGTAGSGGGTAGAGGGTAGAGGGTGCGSVANLLSDFESGKGSLNPVPTSATTGYWYTYKDTSGCASATQVPASVTDGPIAAADVSGAGGPYANASCNKFAMHASISSCQTYSGFGAVMHPTTGSTIRTAVDVSGYDGLSFWAKAGSGTQGPLYLEMDSKECVPADRGGTATNTAIDADNCHGKLFSNFTTTWTQYFVPFGTTGPRWFPTAGTSSSGKTCTSSDVCEAPPLKPANFLSLQFALEDPFNQSGVKASYDVWVDDVALYKFADTSNAGLATWTQTGNNKFPQDKALSGCTKPTGATGKLIQDAYVNWKAKFVVADGSNFKVISPEIDTGSPTVSEGMGYGMLMAAYMGDKPLFDGLLGYWKAHGSAQTMLMTWKIGGTGGSGSATDADEDTAFALQMAVKQWGSAYSQDASDILSQFLANDVDSGGYLKPGNTFGGKDLTNPSYFAPAFYRYFATVDTANASKWNSLVTNVYSQLANISGSNGLVPAWCTSNCATPGSGGKNYTDELNYQYDSHRTPWRIGLDVCWNGSAASAGKTYLDKVVGFFANLATKSGISSIADIYTTSGSISTSSTYAYNSMSLIGSAGVGAMGSSATGADTFRDRAWQFLLGGQYSDNPTFKTGTSAIKPGYTYYNATVGLMTLMTMSGNFYPM